jgi:hypothetical protein
MIAIAALLAAASPAIARHGGGFHGGGAVHFAAPPARGPAPFRVVAPHRAVTVHAPVVAARPHVVRGRWVGHEAGPHDVRFHVAHPWAAGRYTGGIGRGHAYRIRGWDPGRRTFWFHGAYFGLAAWELAYVDDWDWNRDEVVIYDDPDHEGWYLAYNVRLGTYVHVQYDGIGR